MRTVAILCASGNSVYHDMPDLEVYDSKRDARTFGGGMPVVCHPPCGPWSAHCSHQSTASSEVKALGPFCAEQLRQWGGVLEHPAHSRLFDFVSLPKPGQFQSIWSIQVWQAWWGYPMKKSTLLCFNGVFRKDVNVPLRLHSPGYDRRREQLMSKNQRAATNREFAEWLVDIARRSRV